MFKLLTINLPGSKERAGILQGGEKMDFMQAIVNLFAHVHLEAYASVVEMALWGIHGDFVSGADELAALDSAAQEAMIRIGEEGIEGEEEDKDGSKEKILVGLIAPMIKLHDAVIKRGENK